ncbi:hypothetical protein RRU94_00660 [Domibacillus sp. DTU_2020_1001157_1_SI_ALB_TIR_016]|uniref:hypothetical protein n=1 Tax=Domibacillus sp. DTU_2020_1001157_1_SI_ALB_TIR_016 TaxID=3077789 RepID=UPI0028E75007|nr:hypothetical protein [Domibacillus sp. DTU_2020_1001157_1_SI_ALB_TIR_016]WNS78521.1 hypothetical protein RRU94_00660 [Domibacillus sp. DTU_2020_1001157_1_SI_ALB_TIR_016]
MHEQNKELEVLRFLFNRDVKKKEIGTDNLSFQKEDRIQETAYYLKSLKEQNYIEIVHDAFSKGGSFHPVYNNNVTKIWWGNIHLTDLGEKYVLENELVSECGE